MRETIQCHFGVLFQYAKLNRLDFDELCQTVRDAIVDGSEKANLQEEALLNLLNVVHEGRLVPDSRASEGYVNSVVEAGERAIADESAPVREPNTDFVTRGQMLRYGSQRAQAAMDSVAGAMEESRKALAMAVTQNSLDILMTQEEMRECISAIASMKVYREAKP